MTMPPTGKPAGRTPGRRPAGLHRDRAPVRHPSGPAPGANPARAAAMLLLQAVLDRRQGLEDALDALPAREPRDRASGHRIAAAVLRRLGTLDAILEPYLKREPPSEVREALRIGVAELLLLGTPPHAAVSAAVDLVPKPFAGLVNAVLRRIAQAGESALEGIDADRIDTPAWLWTAWHGAYGAEGARAIATALRQPAPLDLSLMPGSPVPEGAILLPNGSARLPAGTRFSDLPGQEGFWAQDVAATLPARLLAVRPGERVADLCAAPGGKTAQLIVAGAQVTAVEKDARRCERLRENLARLGLTAEVVLADAAGWRPPAPLDAVLLDAPCTATGTIRRHPDVARLKRPTDLANLVPIQARLLAAGAAMLRPGGRLVYAVCSLQPEEGEGHLRTAAECGLLPDPIREEEMPWLEEAITAGGNLRTRPDYWGEQGGMDGFFAARFIKA
ncbi:16S rRNA (cytosine967-C5)-methyltransferase [Humitalea rosea]|uniref:16S rRNA (Cytosine967-C5)-methyltransferase n=2 Tax=Humitalea rosea TaxID=990373 RepID=A0A2W7IRW6_9PROT|nr:transcription antitermination factor NusB [Humitalea rosea]PZW50346.1 16S rRNA (cytosine967-C5)-methyltransferase [Humitalea rosea]